MAKHWRYPFSLTIFSFNKFFPSKVVGTPCTSRAHSPETSEIHLENQIRRGYVWIEHHHCASPKSKTPSCWVIYVACVLFLLRFGPPFITRAMPQIQIPAQYFLSFIHPSSYYNPGQKLGKKPSELRKVSTVHVHICTCHKCHETYMGCGIWQAAFIHIK